MTRLALPMLAAFALLSLAACGGGSSDSSGPTPTVGTQDFQTGSGCLKVSYPAGWKLETNSNLDATGGDYCPGSTLTTSQVAVCNADAVSQTTGLFRLSAPPDNGQTTTPARIELYSSAKRCATLADHFDQILAGEQGNATDIGAAADATIAGYPARCATMTFQGTPENTSARVCAFEAGTSVYHMFAEEIVSDVSGLKPVLDQILSTLSLAPLSSQTGSPAPTSS
jgi:hypothetical protein